MLFNNIGKATRKHRLDIKKTGKLYSDKKKYNPLN